MNIGIVGDRYFTDKEYLKDLINYIINEEGWDVTFVTGDCLSGVDFLVAQICKKRGLIFLVERVNRDEFEKFGNKIYYWRNLRLIRLCDKVNIVVKKPYNGRGSIMVRELCEREGKPYRWLEV